MQSLLRKRITRNFSLVFFVVFLLMNGNDVFALIDPLYKSFDIRTESTRPKMLKLLVDHNGLVWAGTDNGVFIFDGINFTKINYSDDVTSSVTALYEDRSGKIWVGYENGKIFTITNYQFVAFNPEEGIPKKGISDFCEDSEGHICFSTKGEGIYYFDRRLYNINTDDGLNDNYCYSMEKLPDGEMCVGTDAGLNFVTFVNGKKNVRTIGPSEGLPDEIVRTLASDKNALWIGMQDHGVAKYDLKQKKLIPLRLKSPWIYGTVNNILIVEDQLWITTESMGIVVITNEGFIYHVNLKIENEIKASDVVIDQENNIWIAESLHLLRTTGRKISMLEEVGDEKLKFIHCIASDKENNIWFTPDQQLGKLSKSADGKLVLKKYQIVKKADIVSLYFDPYGYLWIGTLGEGVFRFNPSSGYVRKITYNENAESSSILSITGKGNIIWVGGFNSVNKYLIKSDGNSDNAQIEEVEKFAGSGSIHDYVYSVFIDSKGMTWFGTDANGIYKYDGKKLMNVSINNSIHGFTEDKKGRIWYTTADAGVGYIDSSFKPHPFHTKDGLSDPTPNAIQCLINGNLLIANANGFDVLNPETKNIIYHSSEETLDNINGDLNSITTTSDGTVWMGTENGILIYRPISEIKINYPKVMLKTVSVFLKPIDINSKKEFSADENNLSFEYTALWYTDPQRVNYDFLLEGYSSKWERTKDHSITFPRLTAGKYIFKIRASINENFSNSKETTFSFEILPPIWQRWWFRILASAAIAGFIMLIVKRRENRLRNFDRLEKDKIKFQFETLKSQVNPHFLFNSFNTLISVIEDKPDMAVEYVEKLSEFFRNIVNYRDKNLVRLSEELSLLDNYIFIQRKRYGKNLKLDIVIDEQTKQEKCVPPLTLQMLAENAIKHNAVSRETPLTISIVTSENRLIIINNLNPKIANEKSAGFGLENIKARYELLTADKVEIVSDTETFRVIIPLIDSDNENINS